ncbi:MAG: Rad52/Rad22 family DNA repair protein [Gemmatimonadaceae bacterium]
MIARQDAFNSKSQVWSALAAPVPAGAISWRQDGKPITRDGRHLARFVCYIEANTVRERLDTVVPGEWSLTLEMLPPISAGDDNDGVCAFKARLQVLGVVREDVGTGRDYKQASTDAFKRAAVRFGIANELYSYEQNWVELDGDGRGAKPLEDPAQAYERKYGKARGTESQRSAAADTEGSAQPVAAAADSEEVSCPVCGGRMWDNRLTKRNPRAPDFKCRDRNCDGVIWPARTAEPAAATTTEQDAEQLVAVTEEKG